MLNISLLDFRSSFPVKSILIALVIFLSALPAFAADIFVSVTCSWPKAIKSANQDSSGSGDDTIITGDVTITNREYNHVTSNKSAVPSSARPPPAATDRFTA